MRIGLVCQRDVDTALAHEDVHAAAQRMESRSVGSLVVVDAEGSPIGILTDRDLAIRVLAEGRNPLETSVGDVMTPHPEAVSEVGTLEGALTEMRRHGVRRLPVIDGDGRLCGVISLDDVVARLAEDLAHVRRLIAETSPRSLSEA